MFVMNMTPSYIATARPQSQPVHREPRSPLDGVEGAGREVHDAGGGARHQPHRAHAQPSEEPFHALLARALYGLREHACYAVHYALFVCL